MTGRKIIVDTYGGMGRHGGGAFSGKDPTKVDRSAAYMARYVAKNVVASGLAEHCEVQLAYAIGVSEPVSVHVDTFGTGQIADAQIAALVRKTFPLTPSGIIKHLDLRRPIYRKTASGGHFGRFEPEFTWEQTDKADALRKAAGATAGGGGLSRASLDRRVERFRNHTDRPMPPIEESGHAGPCRSMSAFPRAAGPSRPVIHPRPFAIRRRQGLALGVEQVDDPDEGERLQRPLDLRAVADDQDREPVGVEVLAGDAVDVGLGDGGDARRVRGELVVGQVVEDQLGERAGDAAGRLELGGEAADDPVLGEVQLGLGDRPRAGDVGQLLDQLDERLLGDVGLDRAAGVERAGAEPEDELTSGRRRCTPCPRGGSG